MPRKDQRHFPRAKTKLLVSYREKTTAPSPAGFARALNLSEHGMLLETLDQFAPSQKLAFEILLDYNRMVRVKGQVVWFKKARGRNRAGIEFHALSDKTKKLIRAQVAAK